MWKREKDLYLTGTCDLLLKMERFSFTYVHRFLLRDNLMSFYFSILKPIYKVIHTFCR